jgi:hypothetical protein
VGHPRCPFGTGAAGRRRLNRFPPARTPKPTWAGGKYQHTRTSHRILTEKVDDAMEHPRLDDQLLYLSRADQEKAVAERINQARIWIAGAGQVTELLAALQFNSSVRAVECTATQLCLSMMLRRDAQEMVRRSERCVSVAIRKAQNEGIRTGRINSTTLRTEVNDSGRQSTTKTIGDLIPGGRTLSEIHAITDGVSDEQFEQVLAEAREKGGLTRLNIARKMKVGGYPATDATPKRSPQRRTPKTDYLVILHRATASLQGITAALEPVTALPDAVTEVEAGRLASDLNRSIRTLVRIKKLLIEEKNR